MKVAIVGAGLTGLSAAYYLGKAKPDWHIDIYEVEDRVGGKIQTKRMGGYVVEVGPDSYLARKTAMTDLINELGLGHNLVRNAIGDAFIYDRGVMKPIPGGSIVGIPTEVIPFAKSTLLSWGGKLRALQDYFKSPYPTDGDVSIGDFFLYHLGQELVDKLIEPLLSGIYGGDIYSLSLDATFPEFHSLERKHGNMVKGMMALKLQRQGTSSKAEGQFAQLIGGLESVVDAVVEQMPSNVRIHKEILVGGITPTEGQYDLNLVPYGEGGRGLSEVVDKVIIATPPQAYKLWFSEDEQMKAIMDIELSSCAVAVMAFEKKDITVPLEGTGFVITRKTDTPLTACTYLSTKWPQTAPEDKVVLRVFLGKPGDDTVHNHEEEELKQIALQEVQKIMGMDAVPLWTELVRMHKSMPQYTVGHRERIKAVKAHMEEAYPGIYGIGTPFDGVGIPDGVRQAKELVARLCEEK